MKNAPKSGTLAMIQPAWHHLSGSNDHRAGELYQTSLMSALMAGIYEGDATYGQIRKYGDFGVGTFNDLDGEMVGFDGTFYQLRSDGSVRPVTGDQKTPFAVVTFFRPEQELDVVEPMTKSDLMTAIEQATDANLFSAVRVDGIFDEVRTRTVQRQVRPFPPLTEAAKHQSEEVFTNVEGTLAGFRSPTYAQGIGVAGFHLHFLRQDKEAGGHALDYQIRTGKVRTCSVQDLRVELPTSAEFLKTNFGDPALSEKIKAAEG
jgi:acetolactate decarboxylase